MAIRVTLSGGAMYGTVRAGAWSDSGNSQEKLEQLQQSLEGIREIEYPTPSRGSASSQSSPGSAPPPSPSRGEQLALSWNTAVKTVCGSVASWELSASRHGNSEIVRDSRHWSEK